MRQKMQKTVSGRGIRLSTDALVDVGNLDENGNIHAADDPRCAFHKGNLLWHSDVTFDAVRATYSILAAHQVPPDRVDTEFADMRAAYDTLDDAMKKCVEDLSAEHSMWYSRSLGGMPDPGPDVKVTAASGSGSSEDRQEVALPCQSCVTCHRLVDRRRA